VSLVAGGATEYSALPFSVIASEAKPSTPPLPDSRAFDLGGMDGFASLAMTTIS
jgi:hypothetical protein